MPQGFQVWDAAGALILDTNSMLGRILGTVAASGSTGSIDHGGLTTGRPFYVCVSSDNGTGVGVMYPNVTISGSTLSWSYDGGGQSIGTAIIFFGVY